jgi:hypothetical protein
MRDPGSRKNSSQIQIGDRGVKKHRIRISNRYCLLVLVAKFNLFFVSMDRFVVSSPEDWPSSLNRRRWRREQLLLCSALSGTGTLVNSKRTAKISFFQHTVD